MSMDNNDSTVIAPARGLYYGLFFSLMLNGGLIGLVLAATHLIK